MARLTLLHGRPDYDYQQAVIDVLEGGAFTATGTGLTNAVLALGNITLTIAGGGLDIGGARTIRAPEA
jgi:hypothetical protein